MVAQKASVNDYQIRSGRYPADAALYVSGPRIGLLFNELPHLTLQAGTFGFVVAINTRSGQTEARCAFFEQTPTAVSPLAAPFGGIERADTLPDAVLEDFIANLYDTIRSLGFGSIRLRQMPTAYAPVTNPNLHHALLTHGFTPVRLPDTAIRRVTAQPFEAALAPAERRRLRKCQQAGFRFEAEQIPDTEAFIAFWQHSRQQMGYALTLWPDTLRTLLTTLPGAYRVFSVWDGPIRIAQCIGIRVLADGLYVFLPASDPAYHPYSPAVLLYEGLYGWAQKCHYRLIDFGPSVEPNGDLKHSLLRFKERLGCQPESRYEYSRLTD